MVYVEGTPLHYLGLIWSLSSKSSSCLVPSVAIKIQACWLQRLANACRIATDSAITCFLALTSSMICLSFLSYIVQLLKKMLINQIQHLQYRVLNISPNRTFSSSLLLLLFLMKKLRPKTVHWLSKGTAKWKIKQPLNYLFTLPGRSHKIALRIGIYCVISSNSGDYPEARSQFSPNCDNLLK